MMFQYFKLLSLLFFALGIGLLIISVITDFSHWFGIYMMKGSMYLLLVGIALYLMEHKSSRTFYDINESNHDR